MSTPSVTSPGGTKRKRGAEMKFYAVRQGHEPGVYHSWADCKAQITNYRGAVYKAFTSLTDAEAFAKPLDAKSPPLNANPKKFYAVQNGKVPGVYTDWPSAQEQITGWTKPKHKSFATRAEAEAFVAEGRAVADPAVVFPPDSPLAGKGQQGVERDGVSDSIPAAKKSKTSKAKAVSSLPTGPGYDWLGPEHEDGFDKRILMDPETGKLRYKTEGEASAKKMMPKTDHHGETLHVWTDGACMGNGQVGSIGGVGVYFGRNDPRNVAEPLHGRQTNNRAELTAIKRALSIAPMNRPVCVHSDSKYAIDCVTTWFVNWRKRGWKTAQGKPVENKELIEDILRIIDDRQLCRGFTTFQWVKGHAGEEENEMADQLAVEGAMESKRIGLNGAESGDDQGDESAANSDDEYDKHFDMSTDAYEELSTLV